MGATEAAADGAVAMAAAMHPAGTLLGALGGPQQDHERKQ